MDEILRRMYAPDLDDHYSSITLERSLRSRGYRTMRSPNDPGVPIGGLPSDYLIAVMREAYGERVVDVGFALLKRLRGDTWVTQEGHELTAKEMTVSHAQNLQRWLDRRVRLIHLAGELEAMCLVADHDGGMHAHDAIEEHERQVFETEPIDFLRELPLYQAISARADTGALLRG